MAGGRHHLGLPTIDLSGINIYRKERRPSTYRKFIFLSLFSGVCVCMCVRVLVGGSLVLLFVKFKFFTCGPRLTSSGHGVMLVDISSESEAAHAILSLNIVGLSGVTWME